MAVSTTGPIGAERATTIFHLSESVLPSMASAAPPEVRPAGRLNR